MGLIAYHTISTASNFQAIGLLTHSDSRVETTDRVKTEKKALNMFYSLVHRVEQLMVNQIT